MILPKILLTGATGKTDGAVVTELLDEVYGLSTGPLRMTGAA